MSKIVAHICLSKVTYKDNTYPLTDYINADISIAAPTNVRVGASLRADIVKREDWFSSPDFALEQLWLSDLQNRLIKRYLGCIYEDVYYKLSVYDQETRETTPIRDEVLTYDAMWQILSKTYLDLLKEQA